MSTNSDIIWNVFVYYLDGFFTFGFQFSTQFQRITHIHYHFISILGKKSQREVRHIHINDTNFDVNVDLQINLIQDKLINR